MSTIPIIRLGDVLLVTLQVDLHDTMAIELQDALSARIVNTGAKGVLLDISAVDMVDSFIARALANISSIARLLGAHTVVVGMQPSVAITLVELGITMTGVRTAMNVDRGMAMLRTSRESV